MRSKISGKSGQDATLDQGEQEAGATIAEAESEITWGNGWQPEHPVMVEDAIDINQKKAEEDLRLRERAQSIFAQGESIMEEAIRSAEAATMVYGANSEGAVEAREMAEALTSQLKECRATFQEAFEASETAAHDPADGLDPVKLIARDLGLELVESARASSLADSVKESAVEALLAVHARWSVLLSKRDEALSQPNPDTQLRSAVSGAGPAKTYTGRLYLMFDASLTREALESVWDAVEDAAGSGVIVDTRMVSQDEGVQVTLDLDHATLEVAAFLRRLPGAELEQVAVDRLKVAWTAAV